MATAITVYQSEDGRLHMNKEDAEFADFSKTMREDIGDFLREHQLQDEDGQKTRLLCDWELWKFGGYNGWLKHCALDTGAESVDHAVLVPVAEQVPVAAKPRNTPEPAYLKHVGVVGLPNGLHHIIEKEFREAFKLTLLSPDEPHRIAALKHCHKVFVMTKNVGQPQLDALHAVGQEPQRIQGGITALREAMLTFYANS